MDAHAAAPDDSTSPVQTRASLLDTEARGRLERIEDLCMRVVLVAGAVAMACVMVTAVALLVVG